MVDVEIPQFAMRYRLRSPESYLARELDGEMVILNLESGAYYSANQIASLIWKGLLGDKTPAEIAEGIAQSFDIDEPTATADVRELLVGLVQEGILEPVEDQ